VELEAEPRRRQVEAVVVDVAEEGADVRAVEPVHRRDETRHLFGGPHQPPLASGRRPHQVGDRTEGRVRPVADDETVAAGEPGAGDDPA
jgi:hypothetical protein